MRSAALLVAVVTIVGSVGFVSPESLTAARRLYFASPLGLYSAGALRMIMGGVVILCARASRAPKILRALGSVMCLQALVAMLLGPVRAQAVLEFEAAQDAALLRAGAAVAIVCGAFVVFAVSKPAQP